MFDNNYKHKTTIKSELLKSQYFSSKYDLNSCTEHKISNKSDKSRISQTFLDFCKKPLLSDLP